MLRTATYLLTIALSFGAGAAVTNHGTNAGGNPSFIIAQAGNAAFRDGLYLGKLSAKEGRAPHISQGRWSAQADRSAFAEGYRTGYESQL